MVIEKMIRAVNIYRRFFIQTITMETSKIKNQESGSIYDIDNYIYNTIYMLDYLTYSTINRLEF